MWYRLKRYFLYRFKALEIYFKTKKKQKEVSQAYHVAFEIGLKFQITRTMLLGSSVGGLFILLIILSIVYSDRISQRIRNVQIILREGKKSWIVKKDNMHLDSIQPYTAVNIPEVKEPVEHIMFEDTAIKAVIEGVFPIPDAMRYLILANKADKKIHLLRNSNGIWSVFRQYEMAIGENNGRKIKSGDKKTPEGLYFIVGRKEKKELSTIYGPLAFVLNYPNIEDIKSGRTGQGIWIHGTNPDSLPLQTRGCLELQNNDLIELGAYLKTGIGTPVFIINKENLQNPVTYTNYKKVMGKRKDILIAYKKKRDFFILHIKRWKNAWESRDIDKYSLYYNTETFFGQGMGWDAWKERKARTFEIYNKIEISLDKIFLADFSESTAVLKFIQGYKSNRLNVANGKKLNFVKSAGEWKIHRESSFPKEELLL